MLRLFTVFVVDTFDGFDSRVIEVSVSSTGGLISPLLILIRYQYF